MPLNMKKQYRAEIRTLKAASRKIHLDIKAVVRSAKKEINRHERIIAQIEKATARAAQRAAKAQAKVNNRILILEGRLA